jgi:hypothetical protein
MNANRSVKSENPIDESIITINEFKTKLYVKFR